MRVLITGSSGQIGTNLGIAMQKMGHEVIGIDKRENDWTDEIRMISIDMAQPSREFEKEIDQYDELKTVDVMVHLAANAKVHELVEHPKRAMDNIQDTFNAVEFCRKHSIPIVFSSSREVYGDVIRDLTSEEVADFAHAESPYSASKIAGEAMVISYSNCYDLPYVIFRFSNVYGRYDNDLERMERVIPWFIKRIGEGGKIVVFGKEKVLDFTYVDDCVRGVIAGIEKLVSGEVKNETFNLAYGQGNSLINMVEFISDALGKKADYTVEPSRVGEVTHYVADISNAQEKLGYQPTTTLQEGIKKCVAWGREFAAAQTDTPTKKSA